MRDPRRIMHGLRIHRDVEWNYSFWRPLDWLRHDMKEQYGFVYSPEQDPRTGFYVSVQDLSGQLSESVTEADLPALYDGLLEGLKALPECEIISEKEISKGYAVGFEVMLTFVLDGELYKRKMRLLYNDRQQFTIYGQGLSASEYEVFHDSYEFIYSTFTFGDLLALSGIPPLPHTATTWEGDNPDVEVRPKAARDHSDKVSS